MTTMLWLDSVSKSYGDLEVLRSVDLQIGAGVQCLVGRNGAGKTTLMRLGLGLTEPSGGRARMFGFDPRLHPEIMTKVGILLEEDELFDFLRPLEFLDYCAALYGLDAGAARARAVDLLETLEVPTSGRLCHQLSTGNRRQLALAAALLHEPELLILDEPFSGLDPVAVARLCRMLRDFAAEGPRGSAVVAPPRTRRGDRGPGLLRGRLRGHAVVGGAGQGLVRRVEGRRRGRAASARVHRLKGDPLDACRARRGAWCGNRLGPRNSAGDHNDPQGVLCQCIG